LAASPKTQPFVCETEAGTLHTKEKWYVFKNDPSIRLKGKDISLLTQKIDFIIYNKFNKYKELNKYLKEIANICVLLQIPILWLLPTGLQVIQSYVQSK
jgi:hypothetical protein